MLETMLIQQVAQMYRHSGKIALNPSWRVFQAMFLLILGALLYLQYKNRSISILCNGGGYA